MAEPCRSCELILRRCLSVASYSESRTTSARSDGSISNACRTNVCVCATRSVYTIKRTDRTCSLATCRKRCCDAELIGLRYREREENKITLTHMPKDASWENCVRSAHVRTSHTDHKNHLIERLFRRRYICWIVSVRCILFLWFKQKVTISTIKLPIRTFEMLDSCCPCKRKYAPVRTLCLSHLAWS